MSGARFLTIGLLVASLGLGGANLAQALTTANLLTDPGWNTPLTNPLISYLNVLGSPYTQNTWGDENSSVVGPENGVTPLEGNGMLRMDDDGLTVTQIWQRVDVSTYATGIDAGLATADLSGWFNLPAGFAGGVGSANLGFVNASNVPISGLNLTTVSIGGLDGNPLTWQQLLNGSVPVPVGTRILEAQFNYVNATMQGQPGYVDAADLRLTVIPEPTTGLLMLLGLVAIAIKRRTVC